MRKPSYKLKLVGFITWNSDHFTYYRDTSRTNPFYNLIIFINLLSLLSFGQTNTIKVLTDLGTHYDYANSIAIQNDGKVV
jgi:hypothetical protein